jgi:hypothetical protein
MWSASFPKLPAPADRPSCSSRSAVPVWSPSACGGTVVLLRTRSSTLSCAGMYSYRSLVTLPMGRRSRSAIERRHKNCKALQYLKQVIVAKTGRPLAGTGGEELDGSDIAYLPKNRLTVTRYLERTTMSPLTVTLHKTFSAQHCDWSAHPDFVGTDHDRTKLGGFRHRMPAHPRNKWSRRQKQSTMTGICIGGPLYVIRSKLTL